MEKLSSDQRRRRQADASHHHNHERARRKQDDILVEANVYEAHALLERPHLLVHAFLIDRERKPCLICAGAVQTGEPYFFVGEAGATPLLVAKICSSCFADRNQLHQRLLEFLSQLLPKSRWKLPLIAMPGGTQ